MNDQSKIDTRHPTPDTRQPLSIGIIGGMSPESTQSYYRYMVRRHQEIHHDHAYPRIVIVSVSFQQYIDWQHEGAWDRIAAGLRTELEAVAAAGADFALVAANTMHKVLPDLTGPIPLLNVLDAVAQEAMRRRLTRLGLTGTRFTMRDGFYAQGLEERGLQVVVPDLSDQEDLHRIIYAELIAGQVVPASVERFRVIAQRLVDRGAEAVLLACTELALLTTHEVGQIPLLDTTRIHAEAALEWAYRKTRVET